MNQLELEHYTDLKKNKRYGEAVKYKNELYAHKLRNMKYMASFNMTHYFYLRDLNDQFYTRYIFGLKDMGLLVCLCGGIVDGKKARAHAYESNHVMAMIGKFSRRAHFKNKRYEYIAKNKWSKLTILYKLYGGREKKKVIKSIGAYYAY